MKILFVNSVYNWGSTGKIVRSLFKACEESGIDAAVCYGRILSKNKPSPEKNVYKFGFDWETKLHALLTRLTGYTGCYSYFSTRRLLKYMGEFKPDIVNLHEPHAYFLNLREFFEYLKKHDIPLVYTFHCEFAFTGKCGFSGECENRTRGCGNCPHLKDYPKSLFFDRTAAMLAGKKDLLDGQRMIVVCPSKWLAERAGQSFLSKYPIKVIANGIDTDIFRPCDTDNLRKKLNLRDEKTVLAVAPDWSDKRKGGEHVLKLAERMRADNVKFILVGKNECFSALPENVLAVGRTENQLELAEYYSLADCFVICSDMENLPTTCLEAICCGTPVAGFDVGGTAETAPGELGRFCKYGDMETLEENVRLYLEHKPDTGLFAAEREKHSLDQMNRQYIDTYTDLLSPVKDE
jgi:putative colanic acid biosynthesis glycosyltransferase